MERLKDNSINDIGRQPDGMPAVLLIGMLKYGIFKTSEIFESGGKRKQILTIKICIVMFYVGRCKTV